MIPLPCPAQKADAPQLIGLSANNVTSHENWVKDINALAPEGPALDFPIIGDESREIATLYGMLDNQDKSNVDKKGLPLTVRTVFISKSMSSLRKDGGRKLRCVTLVVDPQQTIRLTLAYPASTGRRLSPCP